MTKLFSIFLVTLLSSYTFAMTNEAMANEAMANEAMANENKVMKPVKVFFRGMKEMDEALARSAFDPNASLSFTIPKNETQPARVRHITVDQYFQSWPKMKENGVQLEEKIWGEKIQTNGLAASVWTNYALYRNNEFVQCGINGFNLLNVGKKWVITNIISSFQKEGCDKKPPK